MQFGTKLREIREEKGFPIGLVAHYLKVDVRTIVNFELNKQTMIRDQFNLACKLYGITEDDLFE